MTSGPRSLHLVEASQRSGRPPGEWLDLGGSHAPWPYPVPAVSACAWWRRSEDDPALSAAAQTVYGPVPVLPVAGSLAAVRALPAVMQRWHPRARVIVPTVMAADHAAAWSRAGHAVRAVAWSSFEDQIEHCDVAIVGHPNNPTADEAEPERLSRWRERLAARGGWLIVDESFRDSRPQRSLVAAAGAPGLVVLRSLSPFFGLVGARVGFVAARPMVLGLLSEVLGPGCVAGPSAAVARVALLDGDWQAQQRERLQTAGQRLGSLVASCGWPVRAGDHFAWIDSPGAAQLHERLAAAGIWTRCFEVDQQVSLRIGLPGDEAGWQRLEAAIQR